MKQLIIVVLFLFSMSKLSLTQIVAPRIEIQRKVKWMLMALLMSVQLIGQTPRSYLNEFKAASFYEPFNYSPNPCPWQSWRLISYVSISIDLIATDEAMNVLAQEPWLFAEDLLDVYHGYPFGFERLELISRWSNSPAKYRVQIPGLIAPYERYWRTVDPNEALDLSKNPYFGWEYDILPGDVAVAIKQLPSGEWQVSGAIFLHAVDPTYYVANMMANFFLTGF